MEKRILFAFVLSFAVLYGFRALYTPPAPVAEQSAVPPLEPAPQPVPAKPATENVTPSLQAPDHDVRAERAEDLTVDMPLYTVTLSNVGGVLKSYKLKAYSDAEGQPIELIDQKAAEVLDQKTGKKVGWPLAVVTGDVSLDDALSGASFVARREGERVTMEFAAAGMHAQKVFQFLPDNYEFSLASSVTKDGKNVSSSVVWQSGFGDQSLAPDPAKRNALYEVDTAYKKVSLGSNKDPQEFVTKNAGVEDQYFLAMFLLPENPAPVKIRKQDFPGPAGKPLGALNISVPLREGKPVRLYVGPKDRQWLSKADPELTAVVNYGWFEFIARPLLFSLLTIHSYIGNFGWSIIILTIAINFLLFPLRLKQQVSMQKMQKIQPQMRTLQDKFKKLKATDPRRAELQTEMMGLYKQHGVNPMGGCLPLLLQMPVFFGLYSMLSVSIELRRAPWFLWIKDLSQHDPYYIIPVLMAISMFIMQRMTPTTVDPAQAKMMMIMPLMFAFMFLWVQSGLTLYWLTSNVVGIGQQVFINKYWSPHADAKLEARRKLKDVRDK